MIDLGLAKLALIGAVALVVIGPEKLPKVARMAGSLLGRAQRYLNQVKAEVSREMELDELRKVQQGVEQSVTELSDSFTRELHQVGQDANALWEGEHRLPEQSALARKALAFRRNRLVRNSALPGWYKQQQGRRSQLLSAAARVARYRPKPKTNQSFY